MNDINYIVMLEKVKKWCIEIGRFQLERLEDKKIIIENKVNILDYVTDVDKESENRIRAYIKNIYPDHSILGEEYGEESNQKEYLWIIDPIDGTTNYIHSFPLFCISIALQHNGETMIGIVYIPKLNMVYSAIRNHGAYLNDKRIEVSNTDELVRCLFATGFQTNRIIENINKNSYDYMLMNAGDTRQVGSTAISLCMTADGSFDGFWHFDVEEWDYAAGELITKEAGGMVKHYNINGHFLIIGSNKQMFLKIEDILVNHTRK